MTRRIVLVDYGRGNLFSVRQALEAAGTEPVISSDPKTIATADRIVLPGVGAFGDGMASLADRRLLEPLREFAGSGRPLLGICLGMQMLFDIGEEFGIHEGLGLLPGKVKEIPKTTAEGKRHKVPHIGWNRLQISDHWQGTVLEGIPERTEVYFLHSFAAYLSSTEALVANVFYNDQPITAVVRRENVHGCQFHPEKSGEAGLAILRRFAAL